MPRGEVAGDASVSHSDRDVHQRSCDNYTEVTGSERAGA